MNPSPVGIAPGIDPPLAQLAALALDCQTTGASVVRDHVLEIGWARIGPVSVSTPEDPCAYLVALPDGAKIPPKIAKLTGIQDRDLKTAHRPRKAWRRLLMATAHLPVPAGGPGGVVLIHYTRFEIPFLNVLHVRCGHDGALPFQIVCTHAIARRLLPHLPRCGLRALAGYFGASLDERKRAADHAAATRTIWEGLVPLLAAKGVRQWSQLAAWLRRPPASGRVLKHYPMPRRLRLDTPDNPGVYRLRRSNGDLLYVGKARSLKRRINSYFQSRRRHPEHILEMLTQACDLDYFSTPTALEAALLEADLIQRSAPPYNIALKPRATAPVYFSDDFQTAGLPGSPEYPVGPLPSEKSLAAFRFVVAQCGRSNPALPGDAKELAVATDMPAAYLPPRSVLGEGLGLYRKICASPGDSTRTARRLLKRGLFLWRQDQAARMVAVEEKGGIKTGDDKAWSAAAVVALLDGIVRRGSQLVRRGRWLEILANATLCWEALGRDASDVHTLGIQLGRIHAVPAEVISTKAAPLPPLSRTACRPAFTSAATYDRLRVLTTELRRLIGEGRRARILPASGGCIENSGLARILNLI